MLEKVINNVSKSGKKWEKSLYIYTFKPQSVKKMANLFGEFVCKLDAKGRFMLPAGLVRQLSPGDQERFVINRGFEKNLTLYPESEWQKITREINSLNLYNKKNREFVRYFYRGASELRCDSANRLLVPKTLMDYADLDKEIVLFAFGNRIEIWSKSLYESTMSVEPEDFSVLAEDVMGRINNKDPES
jgi:MraZ protein